jgi:hypothetical protein
MKKTILLGLNSHQFLQLLDIVIHQYWPNLQNHQFTSRFKNIFVVLGVGYGNFLHDFRLKKPNQYFPFAHRSRAFKLMTLLIVVSKILRGCRRARV